LILNPYPNPIGVINRRNGFDQPAQRLRVKRGELWARKLFSNLLKRLLIDFVFQFCLIQQ
jgi:hypothetical protein